MLYERKSPRICQYAREKGRGKGIMQAEDFWQ